jgi:hypothetical protein
MYKGLSSVFAQVIGVWGFMHSTSVLDFIPFLNTCV